MTKEELQAMLTELGVVDQAKLNSTADAIRKHGEALDGISTILASITEKAEDGSVTLKIAQATPAKKDDKTPEWQAQLDSERKSRESWQSKFEAEKTAREAEQTKSAIVSAMEKAGAVNASRDYIHVQGMVKRNEDGTYFVAKKDEFGAESKIGLDVAFGDFLKSNPELAKPTGKPGSGTPAGTPGMVGGKDVDALANMSMSEFVAAQAKK